MELTDLTALISDAIIDQRYATTNNITGTVLYHDQPVQLQPAAALQLQKVADIFRPQGLRLVLWDAYRPPDVQTKLRAVVHNDDYVLEDSNHCKGLAIDLTLARADGSYLDMGTDFDDFTPRAHPGAAGLTDEQTASRQLLRVIMEQCGFTQWPYEWWHYDYFV